MKKIFNLFTFLSISVILNAQPTIQWQNSFGGTLNDGFDSGGQQQSQINSTADGGIIFTGLSYSNDGDVTGHHGLSNTSDCWVVKLDSTGSLEWQRSLGGSDDEVGQSVIQTSDGGYLVAASTLSDDGDVTGFHTSTNSIPRDAWIVKLDFVGNIIWENAFGGTGNDIIHSIAETSDGNYIAAGRTSTNNDGDITGNNGGQDILILKIDPTGNLIWQKCIGGTSGDYAYTIKQTSDNGFVISGDVNSTNGDFSGAVLNMLGSTFVMKLDSVANVEWFQIFGGNSLEFGYDVFQTADGGYYHGIASYSSDLIGVHGQMEYAIYRLDAAGSVIWQNCYGGSTNDFFKSFTLTGDGGCALIGQSNSTDGDVTNNQNSFDAWVVKIDSLGIIEWERSFGGTDVENGTSIIVMPDGGLVLGVESNSNDGDVSGHHGPLSTSDIWIAKLAPLSTGITDPEPISFFITAFPNPAVDKTTISFDLLQSEQVSISLFDITGRRIKEVINESFTTGLHHLDIDLKEIHAGTYILKMNLSENAISRRLIIAK